MNRGFYIAGTGMYIERQRMDVITNNFVNVETAGYKKDTLVSRSFKDVLIERINDPYIKWMGNSSVGDLNHGVHIDEIFTKFEQGAVEVTERNEDLMIEGKGLFVVDTPQGERYTRNGNFYLDPQGYMRNADGYAVLGENGPIQISGDEFSVNAGGEIAANGQIVGRLRVVDLEDWGLLRKQGNNLYATFNDAPVQPATNFSIKQGALENSNVDMAREMVEMITSSRTYETNQRMLRMIDDSLDKAVNRIANV